MQHVQVRVGDFNFQDKVFFHYLWYCGKRQIECGLACSVLLLTTICIITVSKFVADSLGCTLWVHNILTTEASWRKQIKMYLKKLNWMKPWESYAHCRHFKIIDCFFVYSLVDKPSFAPGRGVITGTTAILNIGWTWRTCWSRKEGANTKNQYFAKGANNTHVTL